jgi:CheY-like chemotaxis protein
MSDMDGYELVYEYPPKAMACSADWTRETEERCIKAGFDGVLRKPITFTFLRDFLAQTVAADIDINKG